MTLPANCSPCPPVIAHAARHVARHTIRAAHHVTRPFRHPAKHLVHLALRHPGKIIIGVCCAGAVGPAGGALTAPPPNLPAGIYTSPPAIVVAAPEAPTWPEIPSYSGGGGIGPGGIYGAIAAPGGTAPSLLPVYGGTPTPTLIPTQPASARLPSPTTHLTSIPEPATLALLLLPAGIVIAIRRRAA